MSIHRRGIAPLRQDLEQFRVGTEVEAREQESQRLQTFDTGAAGKATSVGGYTTAENSYLIAISDSTIYQRLG